jgi:hypothetical protein
VISNCKVPPTLTPAGTVWVGAAEVGATEVGADEVGAADVGAAVVLTGLEVVVVAAALVVVVAFVVAVVVLFPQPVKIMKTTRIRATGISNLFMWLRKLYPG